MQYKTAFVLTRKLREAMARELIGRQLDGIVEIDGAYFGGFVKPENHKDDRKDRRLAFNRSGSAAVDADAVRVYAERGIAFEQRWFGVLNQLPSLDRSASANSPMCWGS